MAPLSRFMRQVSPVPFSGCWLWAGGTNGSYGKHYFRGANHGAHRVSWLLHKGEIPSGLQVCHKCDVPLCVNPAHLFLGHIADNVADKMRKGRHRHGNQQGTKHSQARLTDDQVREIRAASGTMAEIGQRYGISASAACLIRSGKRWGHVA